MDLKLLIIRLVGIIKNPVWEWKVIKSEFFDIKSLYTHYAMVFFALPSISIIIGSLLRGIPFGVSLILAFILYITILGVIFLMGIVINTVASELGGKKEKIGSHKLAVFSFFIYGVFGALLILPIELNFLRWFITILSFYCLTLLYIGIPAILGIEKKNTLIFFVIIIGVVWYILLFFSWEISTRLTLSFFAISP